MKIQLPASLRETGQSGLLDVGVPALGTLRAVLDELEGRYPTVKSRLLDERGDIPGYVTFYVNGEDVRLGEGLNTRVNDRDEVVILPAISGG
jgi:molybdopterin synthase sulfur carrier subunit